MPLLATDVSNRRLLETWVSGDYTRRRLLFCAEFLHISLHFLRKLPTTSKTNSSLPPQPHTHTHTHPPRSLRFDQSQPVDRNGEALAREGARITSRTAILASVAAVSTLLVLCSGISLSNTRTSTGAVRERAYALRLSRDQQQQPQRQEEEEGTNATRSLPVHEGSALGSEEHDDDTAGLGSDIDAMNAAWNQPPAVAVEAGGEDKAEEDEPFYQYTLVTHVLSIGIASEEDEKNSAYLRKWLSHENRMDFVDLDRYLDTTPGINANGWPERFEDAEYAVRDVEAELASSLGEGGEPAKDLGSLYYVNAIQEARDNANVLPEHWVGIGHHVGCMYAHLYQWQYAWDHGFEDAVVLESDAPWNLGVPAFSFQDIVNHQPFDYDIIFIVAPEIVTGEYLYSFNSHGPEKDETIHMYRWNAVQQAAGLQGYVMSRRFKPKVIKHIVKSGGMDMVDAWLMTKVCSEPQADTGKYALNCYHATTAPPADGREIVVRDADVRRDTSGIVRLGRYELNSYPEDAAIPYDFGEEAEQPAAPAPSDGEPDEEAEAEHGIVAEEKANDDEGVAPAPAEEVAPGEDPIDPH